MNPAEHCSSSEEVIHVFISYAREDKRWLDAEYRFNLIPFLMDSLRRQNVVFWFDKELKPGDEFRRFIESEIDQAQIALLIVSQNFLNSEFIESKEMPRIAERALHGQMIVVPVLVEPCDWSEYPFLADRQMVPSSPLIDYTENEAQWAKVKVQILAGIKAQLKRIRDGARESVPSRPAANGPESLAGVVPSETAAAQDSKSSRRFWGLSAWTWSGCAVTALALVAAYVGVQVRRADQLGNPRAMTVTELVLPSPSPVNPRAVPKVNPSNPQQLSSAPALPKRSKQQKTLPDGWFGFKNDTSVQDREKDLISNCGPFRRVVVEEDAASFSALCQSLGKTCIKVCDWGGAPRGCEEDTRPTVNGPRVLGRDGTRVAYCALRP